MVKIIIIIKGRMGKGEGEKKEEWFYIEGKVI